MTNPFNPSFGKVPSIFLNRDSLTTRIITELNNSNSPFQTSLVYGQRGSGKTTLLTNIANTISESQNWIVVDLVLDDDLLISLINQLNDHLLNLKVDIKFNLWGTELSPHLNQNIEANFQTLFEHALTKLTKKGKSVLILIDEVHDTALLRKLVSCYQIMIRKNLNVALLMAGLPENVSEIQNDNVLTFLLRANRIVLNPLNIETIKNTYKNIFEKGGFTISFNTILYMTKQTQGFAYAFQLLGYYVWELSIASKTKTITKETIDTILDQYISDLFRNVYFKVYQEMSIKEQEFVQAMVKADTQKVKSKTIGELMGKGPNYIAVYRRKLIDDQIIKPDGYGYVSFLLPYFKQFVEQQMFLEE